MSTASLHTIHDVLVLTKKKKKNCLTHSNNIGVGAY